MNNQQIISNLKMFSDPLFHIAAKRIEELESELSEVNHGFEIQANSAAKMARRIGELEAENCRLHNHIGKGQDRLLKIHEQLNAMTINRNYWMDLCESRRREIQELEAANTQYSQALRDTDRLIKECGFVVEDDPDGRTCIRGHGTLYYPQPPEDKCSSTQ